MKMKVILVGAGQLYQKWKHTFDNCQILTIIDNDPSKQGKIVDGHNVEAIDSILDYDFDYIFITTKSYDSIRYQLSEMCIPKERVLDIEHPGKFNLISPCESYFVNDEKSGKHALLLSHTLDRTGAPLVLYTAAAILHAHGYQVHVMSLSDGPLRHDYLQNSISVTIATEIVSLFYPINLFVQWADLIFVNTLVFNPIIEKLSKTKKKVIWWLHEGENYYRSYKLDNVNEKTFEAVDIYGVGHRAVEAFKRFYPNAQIGELLYGIKDCTIKEKEHTNVIFACIGTCDYRKGEDILRKAICMFNDQDIIGCEFWIIGKTDREVREKFNKIYGVRVLGEQSHDELMKLYSVIDAIVCPSRDDPMPVVITEGMMHRKVCIVSDNVGQAKMLQNRKAGIVCDANNPESLFEKMLWVAKNRQSWKEIGDNARELYESNFAIDTFEKKLLELLEINSRDMR